MTALPFRSNSVVNVRLHADARVVQATVIVISETVAGTKLRVLSDKLLLTIDPEQVIKVIKY